MKVLSTLACLAALILLAACGDTPSQQAPTPTAVSAPAADSQTPKAPLPTDTVPAERMPTATTPAEPTATQALAASNIGSVGDTQELIGPDEKPTGLKITLNSVHRSQGEEYFKPKEGHEYVVVDITIENTSDKDAPVSSLLFTGVKDSTGQEYNQSLFGTDKTPPNGTVPPGDLLRGEVAFEIPTDATGLVFSYDMGFGSKQVRFRLDK